MPNLDFYLRLRLSIQVPKMRRVCVVEKFRNLAARQKRSANTSCGGKPRLSMQVPQMRRERALLGIDQVAVCAVEKFRNLALLAAWQRLDIHPMRGLTVKLGDEAAVLRADKISAPHLIAPERTALGKRQLWAARQRACEVGACQLTHEVGRVGARNPLAPGRILPSEAKKYAHVRARVLHKHPRHARAPRAVQERTVLDPEAMFRAKNVSDEQVARAHAGLPCLGWWRCDILWLWSFHGIL